MFSTPGYSVGLLKLGTSPDKSPPPLSLHTYHGFCGSNLPCSSAVFEEFKVRYEGRSGIKWEKRAYV